jgi:hypothetical protein
LIAYFFALSGAYDLEAHPKTVRLFQDEVATLKVYRLAPFGHHRRFHFRLDLTPHS